MGKTTTAINLGASLAARQVKVLIIDSDPQGNATTGLGVAKNPEKPSLYDVLLGGVPASHALTPTGLEGLTLIPADKNLVGANLELVEITSREFRLRDAIADIRDLDTIDRVRESFQHTLALEGILLTMFDDRTNLTRQVATDLKEFFGNEVFKTIIPRSVRLAEAPSFGKPILNYDPRSRGAESYIKLAKEILDHEQTRQPAQSVG